MGVASQNSVLKFYMLRIKFIVGPYVNRISSPEENISDACTSKTLSESDKAKFFHR